MFIIPAKAFCVALIEAALLATEQPLHGGLDLLEPLHYCSPVLCSAVDKALLQVAREKSCTWELNSNWHDAIQWGMARIHRHALLG